MQIQIKIKKLNPQTGVGDKYGDYWETPPPLPLLSRFLFSVMIIAIIMMIIIMVIIMMIMMTFMMFFVTVVIMIILAKIFMMIDQESETLRDRFDN